MKSQLRTILLLGFLSAVLIGFGSLVGPGYTWFFVAVAVVMNLGAYFFSDKIVLRMHRARQLDPSEAPQLFAMTRDLCMRAKMPMPKLYLIPGREVNAFATGRSPSRGVVAVTEGIVRTLSPRELRGVIAHELAHIKNRDILITTIAALLAAAISQLANIVQFSSIFGGRDEQSESNPLAALVAAMLAPFAALLIQMGISRAREYLADEVGARMAGDPLALADALRKISGVNEMEQASLYSDAAMSPAMASLYIINPFSGHGGFLSWLSTHPPIEARIERLERMAGLAYRIAA